MKRRLLAVQAWLVGFCGLCSSLGMAAEVDVYAEGAYTETHFAVHIYADINGPAILSYGVKLTYDPAELAVIRATKNDAVWYLGDGTPSGNYAYMDPESFTAGEVVIIGGKLDTAAPAKGVTGARVLLGKIFFDRTESNIPFSPTIALSYARMTADNPPALGDYKNFVATDGTVLDNDSNPNAGVAFFNVETHRRGDANADDAVNVQDIGAVRYQMTHGGAANPWKDCNGDGTINVQDIACVQYIMTH